MDALLVGLGNPGPEYATHRHNVGFMALERVASRYSFGTPKSRFRGLTAEGRIGQSKVLGLKPTTYMNRSGDAVAEAIQFYKLKPAQVIVLYDELDLAAGKMKVKKGGGAAGHNGIRSIDAAIGPDFWRVRIGIGHPGHEGTGARLCAARLRQGRPADWLDPLLDAIADEIGGDGRGQKDVVHDE